MDRRKAFFVLFSLSGFTGLIYESIWTHYLKLFLGHAAYAQTLVLAIFMGGMAIGSALCSRYSRGWRNPLLCYALAEGCIGLCAFAFHTVFVNTIAFAYENALPGLSTPLAIMIIKWGISSLLILPQSILLGATFPLMSAAFLRLFPDRTGSSIAMLYFTNSIGAAIGVLVTGFLLIRIIGLPGTIELAGVINIVLACTVYWLARNISLPELAPASDSPTAFTGSYRLFLIVSLLTGAASFIYEIAWIRMLSLVLGASTHSFEVMLSAFILGLALGGLWIRSRIDGVTNPLRFLAIVQMIMGVAALATMPLYGNSFSVMQWLIGHLAKTDSGYLLFNVASHSIACAIMLPATFCAGMTLPLITFLLLRNGHGEKSVGAVYAMNTVGAIVGVFFAIHLGMPQLGLKGLLICGAVVDIGLGVFLAWSPAACRTDRKTLFLWSAACAVSIAAALVFVRFDQYKLASGVYRKGELLNPTSGNILFYRDGKTASVSVAEVNGDMSIRTNGKSDSSIRVAPDGRPSGDETTMILAGVLPLAFHPSARTVANIGFGTGLSTQTLLGFPQLQVVDTIEIEPMITEAARLYGSRVERVYRDTRSQIHIDDAKSFFFNHGKRYDVIVSEPSNPWVSGVAGLFSNEFYRMANNNLNNNGVLVQWLQLYEIDLELVVSVLKAISDNFTDYAVYASNNVDLLIIARKGAPLGRLSDAPWGIPDVRRSLERVGIAGIDDLRVRQVGTKRLLDPFLATFPIRANSDYFPVLDQNADRARFMNTNSKELISIVTEQLPVLPMLTPENDVRDSMQVSFSPFLNKAAMVKAALAIRDTLLSGNHQDPTILPAEVWINAASLRSILTECRESPAIKRKVFLFNSLKWMVASLNPAELKPVWTYLDTSPCRNNLDPVEENYIGLFKALGDRMPAETATQARKLLESDVDLKLSGIQYLVAAGMLGSLAGNDRQGVEQLWQSYRPVLDRGNKVDPIFRLLRAQAGVK